jgi:N-acetylglucosamine kinase-like BadF-type ATPase
MTGYVVGVDGGSTKTIALVADMEGHIVGAARGGNSNWTGTDVEIPMRVVINAVQGALRNANVPPEEIRLGVFGLAGADWPEDYECREAFLSRAHIARQVIVKNDAVVGWRAGTRHTFGVVIAAGTASNTCIITPDGREWCYGYYAFDGGGVDIAKAGIDAVLRAEDGRGCATQLTTPVLDHLGFATPDRLLRAMIAGSIAKEEIAMLCPLVFRAANNGDAVAAEILVKQGEYLAECATAAIRRFDMAQKTFDVVLAGSVFKGEGPLLIDTVTQCVHRVAPQVSVVRAKLEPAVGAILLAYDALEIPVSDRMMDNLVETLPDPELFSTADSAL